ncbi:RNA methyltransferase [Armatimonas rosea]|uniref:SAM-dependent methyltransferase n=1 Tax=Armatimonas rosea TaxID=685828 RepID=A0A7W9SKG3_ARMRO|nr:RNA methyltransferase [Armatimonas rosea]MBB6048245.1 SAM-dependent methyltransferase [Armatimonas rosea]
MRSEPSKPGKRGAARATPKPAAKPGRPLKGGKTRPVAKAKPEAEKKPAGPAFEYILETIPGLEAVASVEIKERFTTPPKKDRTVPGLMHLAFTGKAERLLALRSIVAVFRRRVHPVPRPTGLLGHQYFSAILADCNAAIALHPEGSFTSLRLAAAGRDSAVMARIASELAKELKLDIDTTGEETQTLLVRLLPLQKKVEKPPRRRSRDDAPEVDEYVTVWESLVSLSPRPLSTRTWRKENYPGAVNACVGYAMGRLVGPAERFLNLCAGSGTILIEREQKGALGCDTSKAAREAAAANGVELADWDATAVPLEDGWADAIVADLPFGQRIGSHKDNVKLYPALLTESARLLRVGGTAVFLTHELKLFEQTIGAQSQWQIERVIPLTVGGMHPKIYMLKRLKSQAGGGAKKQKTARPK